MCSLNLKLSEIFLAFSEKPARYDFRLTAMLGASATNVSKSNRDVLRKVCPAARLSQQLSPT